ncbi:hypothetical protein [Microbacterium sp. W4I20]|uniref:hypothetical protein n=1 Tax=Microbacterium sp. W4I20 TaxID=3042262 RepID=UPI002783EDC7|nr:hypothetical protein [Microbacterium sp. W4I20]MDQ0729134.1 hypothetical protein [Microbacterium sp. W4I20]
MKTVITQVGTYTTTDKVADALMHYWTALMEERRGDVIDLPIMDSHGKRSHVRLAVNGNMPIAVADADSSHEFDDDEAADRLLARARSLSPITVSPFAPEDMPDGPGEYDIGSI